MRALSLLMALASANGFASLLDFTMPACGAMMLGLDPAAYVTSIDAERGFVERAVQVNPGLRMLTKVQLDELKREKYVLMFVGYSGGPEFKANEAAYRTEVAAYLRALEAAGLKHRVALLTGGTNEGVPALVYALGHTMGFETVGVTSRQAGKHEPARMNYLLVDGIAFGDESDVATNAADYVIAFGSGGQGQAELLHAKRDLNKPTMRVETTQIGIRRTSAMPYRLVDEHIPMRSSGVAAAADFVDFIAGRPFSRWVRNLEATTRTRRLTIDELNERLTGLRRIGFTGWSRNNVPSAEQLAKGRTFALEFLAALDPAKHVICTGGTDIADSAENFVHDVLRHEAKARGFKVVAFVAHAIADKPAPLFEADYVVPVARSWSGFTHGFSNNVDMLVSFGGGATVDTQVLLAARRGIPTLHVTGYVERSDLQLGGKPNVHLVDSAAAALALFPH